MKNFRKIVLSLVLAVVMCFPVFLAVGCGEKKENEEKTTVASDVANAYNDYIALLVKKNNDLVKEENEQEPQEGPTPVAINKELDILRDKINSAMNAQRMMVEGTSMIDYLKQDAWYESGRAVNKVTKDGEDYVIYSRMADADFVARFDYENGKLAKVETTQVGYSTFTQDDGKWTEKGVGHLERYTFDANKKTEYNMNVNLGFVDTSLEKYFNAVEEFIGSYNESSLTLQKMNNLFNNMSIEIDVYSTEKHTTDFMPALIEFKKNGLKIETNVPAVNIFEVEEDTTTEEERDRIDAENAKLIKQYEFFKNGLIVSEDDIVVLDWAKTKEVLAQLVTIAQDYKEWEDNLPEMAEDPFVYEPYEVERYNIDTSRMIDRLQNALNSMDYDYIKDTWNTTGELINVDAKSFNVQYPSTGMEEELVEDIICSYRGVEAETEGDKIVYIYTFSEDADGYGYRLDIKFDENKKLIGFGFGEVVAQE